MDEQNHVGESGYNKYGSLMLIIAWSSYSDIYVQFQDDHMSIVHTTYGNFKKQEVKNPYDKSVCGIGYVGDGQYKTRLDGEHPVSYLVWVTILRRCYCEDSKDKYPAYYGRCTVCDEWLNYQNFASWYEDNQYDVDGRLHIDKDILTPGNMVYAPEFCLLVPQRINMQFMRCKQSKSGLPRGVRKTKRGYIAVYNARQLGTFETAEQAIKAHREAWAESIRIVADSYYNIVPLKVYNAVMIAAERIEKSGIAALTKG